MLKKLKHCLPDNLFSGHVNKVYSILQIHSLTDSALIFDANFSQNPENIFYLASHLKNFNNFNNKCPLS